MPTRHHELARLFREDLWNAGRLEIADQILSPDCRIDARVPFSTDFLVGPEALKQLLSLYRESYSDIQMEIQDTVAEGDRVVSRWNASGVHTGLFFLPEARGRKVSTSGVDFLVVRDDRIVEGWISWDLFGLLQTLGVSLPGDADWLRTGDLARPG